jgi:hypothetical protein
LGHAKDEAGPTGLPLLDAQTAFFDGFWPGCVAFPARFLPARPTPADAVAPDAVLTLALATASDAVAAGVPG